MYMHARISYHLILEHTDKKIYKDLDIMRRNITKFKNLISSNTNSSSALELVVSSMSNGTRATATCYLKHCYPIITIK